MRQKNLLIDEYPLLVLPSLAQAVGLGEAIVLQQVHYWLENPKGGVEMDGFRWVYNTYENWQKDNFPFWSVRTIQRLFANLEEAGLVISAQKAAYDRKKYYRIHYDKLASWNTTSWHDASRQTGIIEDAKVARSLTETTKENTQTLAEVVKSAKKTVDFILENEKKRKYQNREKFPEPLLPFADLYNELTTQEPTKRVLLDWLQTFDEWKQEGLQPEHIRAAWQHANRPEGGFMVGRPGALTNTAVGMKTKMIVKPSQPAIDTSEIERTKKMLEEKWSGKYAPINDEFRQKHKPSLTKG